MAALDNRIVIGPKAAPLVVFTNGSLQNTIAISKVGGVFGVDVVGNQLSIDQVQLIVQYGKPNGPGLTVYMAYVGPDGLAYAGPDGMIYVSLIYSGEVVEPTYISLRDLPYGTPVFWWNNGILIAAFYLKQVERVGRYAYRITAISGVGLLDALYHTGGIYTGQTFEAVAGEIIGGQFPFTVGAALAAQKVYGWLPYDTRRNNLHQLLFALGASVRRDANGEISFVFLSDAAPTPVPDSRVAFGGSVDYEAPASAVEVTEHAYLSTAADETLTLFDNTQGGSAAAANTLVTFEEPAHNLLATGTLTINSSGVNYAYVTGVGTLTGQLYTHNTRIVTQQRIGATVENVKRVTDMTLVSIANSSNVAKRVLAYYSQARRVRAKIALDGERCGDVLSVSDPYYEPMTAFLETADVNASGNLLGNCTLIEGYSPVGQGNSVSFSDTLTGSGTWISPISGTITYVMISGADGGGCGYDGEAAPAPTVSSDTDGDLYRLIVNHPMQEAGKGGKAGTPGAGGRVLFGTMTVTEGQQISYSCGVGGTGALSGDPTATGSKGTDTTFGSLSTASGQVSPSGYIDPISGTQYAAPGDVGIDGGDGVGYQVDADGNAVLVVPPAITFNGVTYAAGNVSGGEIRSRQTGSPTSGYGVLAGYVDQGLGGGPAAGNPGANGSYGSIGIGTKSVTVNLGYGGKGGDATKPSKPARYGQGGTSGNGGGGRGAFSRAETQNIVRSPATRGDMSIPDPPVLEAGRGSDGGDGGDGVILIYGGD